MNVVRAIELQKKLAKEAVAMIELAGKETPVQEFVQAIALVGKAWNVPHNKTHARLALIHSAKTGEKSSELLSLLNDRCLLANWSGMEILEAMEDLFETTLHLNNYSERVALFDMAMGIGQAQNFLDWIEKTPEEKAEFELPTKFKLADHCKLA